VSSGITFIRYSQRKKIRNPNNLKLVRLKLDSKRERMRGEFYVETGKQTRVYERRIQG
jgi:hypothetical protein